MEIGPSTNVALAIRKDPETMKKVKKIWLMGSAGPRIGNATPVAEFNVLKDAEAVEVLLASAQKADEFVERTTELLGRK